MYKRQLRYTASRLRSCPYWTPTCLTCLSRQALAPRHVDGLAQQALVVLCLPDGAASSSGTNGVPEVPKNGSDNVRCWCVSVQRSRPAAGFGHGEAAVAARKSPPPNRAFFDSDARPLSGTQAPQAEVAIDVLEEAGN